MSYGKSHTVKHTTSPNYIPDSRPPNQSSSVNKPCEHKWVHMDTKKHYENRDFNTMFVRIDSFYCENCCEIKLVSKSDYTREEPGWY